jgi:hypothetical protein
MIWQAGDRFMTNSPLETPQFNERKRSFFEKKEQKTCVTLDRAVVTTRGPIKQKFFCFFFFKKRSAFYFPTGR